VLRVLEERWQREALVGVRRWEVTVASRSSCVGRSAGGRVAVWVIPTVRDTPAYSVCRNHPVKCR